MKPNRAMVYIDCRHKTGRDLAITLSLIAYKIALDIQEQWLWWFWFMRICQLLSQWSRHLACWLLLCLCAP